jgi:DNA-binding FadR family transcriptional regulator
MTSQLAAERISDEALEALRLTVEQMRDSMDDRDSFLDSNKRFHDIIAWSSGNVLFSYFVDSLLDILDGTVIGIDYPKHRRAAILKAHEEIYTALARHDAQVSLDRMREHIEAYATYARRKFPEVLDQVITWDRQPGREFR